METLLIKLNTTPIRGRYTMKEAIYICRQRAMGGEVVELYARPGVNNEWTHLGCYEPAKTFISTDPHTGEKEKIECCLVTPEPPKKYHL